jgi:hypothetical protein
MGIKSIRQYIILQLLTPTGTIQKPDLALQFEVFTPT